MRKTIVVESSNDFLRFEDITNWVVGVGGDLFIYDDQESLLAQFAAGQWWNVRFEYDEE